MRTFCIIIASFLLCLPSVAQQPQNASQSAAQKSASSKGNADAASGDDENSDLSVSEIQGLQSQIVSYIQQVDNFSASISKSNLQQLKVLRRQLESVDYRWKTFLALEQDDIATSPVLTILLGDYQTMYQTILDSIASQEAIANARVVVSGAKAFMAGNMSKYNSLLKQAQQYSLIPQTAPLLSKVKAREQLLTQQVTDRYNKAVAAANLSPDLKSQLADIENSYISIQEISQKIQAMVYKPFLERIKDTVMSIACIAIIIMFCSMVVSRISAFKKARELAKKFGTGLNGSPQEIPTI